MFDFSVVIVQEAGDGSVGKGADEVSQCLEGGHLDPTALVPQEVDEEWRQLRVADGRRADARDGHEGVGAGLAHTPHPVLAQVEEFGQLKHTHAQQDIYYIDDKLINKTVITKVRSISIYFLRLEKNLALYQLFFIGIFLFRLDNL